MWVPGPAVLGGVWWLVVGNLSSVRSQLPTAFGCFWPLDPRLATRDPRLAYHDRMPYPERLLSPGETVHLEFRPHWQRIITPTAITVVAIAAIVAAIVLLEDLAMWISLGAVLIVWLGTGLPRYLDWWFTRYVVTNERVIVRSGVLARHGKEIPLEVINDVAFSQSILERMVHSGDLLIKSAGEHGQSRFTDVPRPEEVQSQVYQLREKRTMSLDGGAGGGAAGQLEALARLHRDGVLTDEEFAAKKEKLLNEI